MFRRATSEDLREVPDHLVAELIDGELYTWPRPSAPHARAATALGAFLFTRFDDGDGGSGGWWIILEPELILETEKHLVPDIGGWRRERVPEFPDASGCTVVSDWVCEIQSPSNARYDRVVKLPHYAKHGVAHVWMIDTTAKLLEVLRLENGRWTVAGNYGGDDVVRAEPFDAVDLRLSNIWVP